MQVAVSEMERGTIEELRGYLEHLKHVPVQLSRLVLAF